MNARMLRLALGAVVALALAATTWAQEQDALLQRYDLAVDHLQAAVEAMPDDGIKARESLDRAFASLLTLARDAAGSNLVTGMERVFERARTAITNASRDDLAVQTAVLEGAFQRLVYDAALGAALQGDPELARARLDRIAEDIGFAPTDRAALVDPNQSITTLRFLVEAGVASVVQERLALVSEVAATDTGAAYRTLARAYGHFLLVQDSPRVAATLNQTFVDAATALVGGATQDAIAAVDAVVAEVAAMGTAAQERQTSVPGGGTAVVVAPVGLPLVDDPATASPDATLPVDEAPQPGTPANGPTPGEAASVVATDPSVVPGDLVALADVTAVLMAYEERSRRTHLDAWDLELGASGMPAALRTAHAERLLAAGFADLDAAVASVSAAGARALAAAHLGDDAVASSEMASMAEAYERWLAPIVRPVDASLDLATASLLRTLQATSPLRVQDVVVAIGQIDAVRVRLRGPAEVPSLQRGAAATTQLWAGPVRDLLTLFVGVLALIPLFLLNLAFGGGNRHWQAVGVALFLLWVPALFEGVIGLGGVLSRYAGIDALMPLAAFSILGSAAAQTVWVAMTLLAVIFAMVGLGGISRQFGLLGGRRRARAGTSTTATRGRGDSQTTARTVDWDDEG